MESDPTLTNFNSSKNREHESLNQLFDATTQNDAVDSSQLHSSSDKDLIKSETSQSQKKLSQHKLQSVTEKGVGVTIMMKPIKATGPTTGTTTTTTTTFLPSHLSQNHKKSNDKLFNIGFESLKLNNPVPFNALKNVKEHQNTNNSNSSSLCGTHYQSQPNNSSQAKLPNNALIAQRSISFKNSSLESLSTAIINNNTHLTNHNESAKPIQEKDQIYSSTNGILLNDAHSNYLNNSGAGTENVGQCNSINVCNNSGANRSSSVNNENTALCRRSNRSDSNSSNRKEKKTSVGYRLGKRKLLFEKSKCSLA